MSLTKDLLVACHCHEQTVFAHFGAVGCYVAYCNFSAFLCCLHRTHSNRLCDSSIETVEPHVTSDGTRHVSFRCSAYYVYLSERLQFSIYE